TPQSMATVLANLESKGYITRSPASMHQKVLLNRLTRQGHAVLKASNERVRAMEEHVLQSFKPDEIAALRSYLERAGKALEGFRSEISQSPSMTPPSSAEAGHSSPAGHVRKRRSGPLRAAARLPRVTR